MGRHSTKHRCVPAGHFPGDVLPDGLGHLFQRGRADHHHNDPGESRRFNVLVAHHPERGVASKSGNGGGHQRGVLLALGAQFLGVGETYPTGTSGRRSGQNGQFDFLRYHADEVWWNYRVVLRQVADLPSVLL